MEADHATQAAWPRYSSCPFPAYAFRPGSSPHPRRHPAGHAFGLPEPAPPGFPPEAWRASEAYRYALDLYNYGYWWECHEIFEGLWRAVGPRTEQGSCLRGLIDLAAGNLKLAGGAPASAQVLWSYAVARLDVLPASYMGLDIPAVVRATRRSLADLDGPVVPILLGP